VECKVCGQDNPPEANFCGNCGATLVVTAESPGPTAEAGYPAVTPAVTEKYADFWIRFGAAIIDAIVVWLISFVLSFIVRVLPFFPYGWFSVLVTPVPIGLLYYWLFIGLRGQTPGKMAVSIKVVNYEGDRPGLANAALREILGKLISTIVLFIGFLWIIFDDNKQGWHDKIASTYVVKVESRRQEDKGL
jgi:uncharacterized RDD family membrane protein YckC